MGHAGSGDRRVYVMEQAAPFIKGHRLGQGDAIGLCINTAGNFVMLANTPQVHQLSPLKFGL